MWERIKARWRRIQIKREELRLLQWRTDWRPAVWTAFVPYKYLFAPHKAVKNHIAGLIMPKHRCIFYRPDLTVHERRLVGAMALVALQRMYGNPAYSQNGTLLKPYVILTKDLRFPEGPEDNEHWIDWLAALEYLAPMVYVDHLVDHYSKKVELYLTQVFDLSLDAAKQRLTEHRMWKEIPDRTLTPPQPARLIE